MPFRSNTPRGLPGRVPEGQELRRPGSGAGRRRHDDARADFGAEGLGGVVLQQGPDEGRRPRDRDAGEATQLLGREEVLRQEPAEPVVVEFADERRSWGGP